MTESSVARRFPPPRRRQDTAALGAFVVLSMLAGGLGSLATTPAIPTWYAGLTKPWFTPPNVVFPVVWTVLYLLMALAAWLAWRARFRLPGPDAAARSSWALVPFFIQLALNVLWSFAFFGARSPFLGLTVIAALIAAIVWTVIAFATVSRGGAALLLPYLAWVAFAALLNAAIYELN